MCFSWTLMFPRVSLVFDVLFVRFHIMLTVFGVVSQGFDLGVE